MSRLKLLKKNDFYTIRKYLEQAIKFLKVIVNKNNIDLEICFFKYFLRFYI